MKCNTDSSIGTNASDGALGYKRSDVGDIPNDWSVKSLGELTIRITNGFVGTATTAYVDSDDGVLYIQGYNVKENDFNLHGVKRVSRAFHQRNRKSRLITGDVLTIQTGDIGVSAVVPPSLEGANCHALVISRFDRRAADPTYFCELFNSERGRVAFKEIETGSTMKHLNVSDMVRLMMPVPPFPEQQAIAAALSDVHVLLTAMEELIKKKQAIKQAATQQLLTGKLRLPGFVGKWKTTRLGDHTTFLRHGTNSRAELTTGDAVKYLHYGDIHTTTHVYLDVSAVQLPTLPTHSAKTLDRLQDGDLVFVDASEDLEGVGKSIEVEGIRGEQAVSGLHTIAARFDKAVLADGFKAYLQFYPAFRNHLRRLAAGTKVYATSRVHIASVEIPLPNTDEQTAIATILSDMDAEIASLEARRDKIRLIKQGMMQQLLTGRIRLVKPQPAEVNA